MCAVQYETSKCDSKTNINRLLRSHICIYMYIYEYTNNKCFCQYPRGAWTYETEMIGNDKNGLGLC